MRSFATGLWFLQRLGAGGSRLTRSPRVPTGEWCVAENVYEHLGALNRTQFDTLAGGLAARTGPPCSRLDKVTCYRTRNSFGKAWAVLNPPTEAASMLAAAAPAPAARPAAFVIGAPQPAPRAAAVAADVAAVGGRRRLRQA